MAFFSLPVLGAAATFAADLWSKSKDRKVTRDVNASNIQMQKDFAKQGIQWRVEDAKKAGIHPLAAMGASTHSPSFASQPVTGNSVGDAVKALDKYRNTKQQNVMLKNAESDTVLKLAQASKLAKETQQMNSVQPMFRQVYDNNPDSPTAGKKIWIPHEDIAESMEGSAAFWSSVYSTGSTAAKATRKRMRRSVIPPRKFQRAPKRSK